jgi:hypothetical protein
VTAPTPPRSGDRPSGPLERYRLYIDESGDHVFREAASLEHRFLCLLGCFFRGDSYQAFHDSLEAFKRLHVPHSPDEPVILHREDIINRRGPYWRLRDESARSRFDEDLTKLIAQSDFRLVAVVIDKTRLKQQYGEAAAHPYHLALGFMLQRYCGYLNHINREGDVLAESRGGKEDLRLKDSFALVYNRGAWRQPASFFQQALTSAQLKLKPKTADIAGLQLADLLGHPVKQNILREHGLVPGTPTAFAAALLDVASLKFNRHLYDGRVRGYGTVLFPRPEKETAP